jgi:hypothetical protein
MADDEKEYYRKLLAPASSTVRSNDNMPAAGVATAGEQQVSVQGVSQE